MKRFNVGEYVIYDVYGVCEVKGIESKSFFSGAPLQEYYVLGVRSSPGSTYYVPVNNESLCSKIRYPLTKEEIHCLLQKSADSECGWIDDRRVRVETFQSIIQNGVSAELVALIRCIYEKKSDKKSEGKKLSATDESMFSAAENMLRQEFAFSLGIDVSDVSEYIGTFFNRQR